MKKILMAAVAASAFLLSGCMTTATGQKNGSITKLAKSGVFCPTWEAEIVRGGFNDGSGVVGRSFEFTIESDAMLKIAQQAIKEQREVRIEYHKEAVSFCRSDSDSYFLDKIEIVAVEDGGTVRKDSQTPATQAPVAGATLSGQQVDRLLDQNERLIKVLEAKVN